MSLEADFLVACEVHSPEGIRDALIDGLSADDRIDGKTPINCLIESYMRSSRFAECLRVLIDAGATTGDPMLEALLLDDETELARLVDGKKEPGVGHRLSAPSAFTSCDGVSPLHICAEFNSVRCGRVLLKSGANVNTPADIDENGFGGQTPTFHAVNSIFNYCRPMLDLLVEAGADLDVRLRGLVWGSGADWETLVLDVTPVSYAQCGLYSQFHRHERDVYDNLAYLYEKRHGASLPIRNVPNKYLASGR